MKLALYVPGRATPFGGTATIKKDLLRGLVVAVDQTDHSLLLLVEPDSNVPPLGQRTTTVLMRNRLRRLAASHAKRTLNTISRDLLGLPNLFLRESWADDLLRDHEIDFLINLGPETVTYSVPYACAVFDLQHRYQPFMPEVCHRGYWERWDSQYRRLLGRATIVVTGTEAGRTELKRYFQVDDSRIVTARHPTPMFALEVPQSTSAALPDKVRLLSDAYLFYPAQFWPHKNHVSLLEALVACRSDHGLPLHLVLVGSDQGNLTHIRRAIGRLNLEQHVTILGHVNEDVLIALYQGAFALTYVSTCGPENLPPLEAMALGCPVIASDVPGAEEQLGNAALLVNATDARQIAFAIRQLWDDRATRTGFIERGAVRARDFTATDFANTLLKAIGKLEPVLKNWDKGGYYERRHNPYRLLFR